MEKIIKGLLASNYLNELKRLKIFFLRKRTPMGVFRKFSGHLEAESSPERSSPLPFSS